VLDPAEAVGGGHNPFTLIRTVQQSHAHSQSLRNEALNRASSHLDFASFVLAGSSVSVAAWAVDNRTIARAYFSTSTSLRTTDRILKFRSGRGLDEALACCLEHCCFAGFRFIHLDLLTDASNITPPEIKKFTLQCE